MAVKRKATRVNYTQMTLKALRAEGFTVEKVEHWNPFANRRVDAFGFIDIIALRPGTGIVAIQSTGPSGHAEHRKKIVANEFAAVWLDCGGSIELWSWHQRPVVKGGKRLIWQPRIENITHEDLP